MSDKTSGKQIVEKEDNQTESENAFKTYKEITKIISDDLGVRDAEAITETDLNKLVKISNVPLTKDDIKLFITVKENNKKYKMLAVPDLPEGKTLSPPDLQKIESLKLDKQLEVFKGPIDNKAQAPIDFSTMTAADWVKVILNCNMTYGRVFRKLGSPNDRGAQPMFFPPNEMLFGTSDFNVSQVALFFSQTSEKVENFSDKSVMTNLSVGASISTPWVAGSAEFSHETKNRTAEKGSNIKSVFKVEVPIGIFTLPRPSELKNSKIKLNDDFKSFVNKYLEDHPDCTREKIQEAMTERFGDVVPQSVKIGVACYTTDITKLEESQSLEAVSNSFAASVKGAYGCFSGGGHAGYGQGSSNKEGNSSQDKTFTFSAIAGSLPDPNNPMSVADYRVLPISWRIIDFGDEFTPVYDYLDEDVKDHLNKIQSSTTSVNTDKTHLYPGQSLDRGDQLITSGFRLIMQHDGDLALYCGPYSNLLWNTDTAKSKACRLICEGSGNLALVDNDGRTHWASNTAGKGIQRFVLKDNGNFVGYKGEEIIWQTETANKFSIDGTSMFKGATLRKGNKLVSSSGKEELRLRMDGNLEWCGQNGGHQLLSFSSKSNTQELHFDGRALCAISRQTKLVATRMVWSIRISLQSLARFTLIDGQALKGYDRDGKLIVVESMHSLSRSYCPSSQ